MKRANINNNDNNKRPNYESAGITGLILQKQRIATESLWWCSMLSVLVQQFYAGHHVLGPLFIIDFTYASFFLVPLDE